VGFIHGLKGDATNEAQPLGVPETNPALPSEKAGKPGGNEPESRVKV
jgi:hypothetical protein